MAKRAGKKATRRVRRTAGKAAITPRVMSVAAFKVAAAARKSVTFVCSNPGCVGNITIGSVSFPAGTPVTLDPGAHPVFYSVSGSGGYTLTVTGATLSAPISSEAPDAGVRVLTV